MLRATGRLLPPDAPSILVTADRVSTPQVHSQLSLSSVYLLPPVLIHALPIAGARIVGNLGIGVYLGFLLGFGASWVGYRCMHVAVVTAPSPYPFHMNLGLSEVQHFPLSSLTVVHRAFTLIVVLFIILVVLFISHYTHLIH